MRPTNSASWEAKHPKSRTVLEANGPSRQYADLNSRLIVVGPSDPRKLNWIEWIRRANKEINRTSGALECHYLLLFCCAYGCSVVDLPACARLFKLVAIVLTSNGDFLEPLGNCNVGVWHREYYSQALRHREKTWKRGRYHRRLINKIQGLWYSMACEK